MEEITIGYAVSTLAHKLSGKTYLMRHHLFTTTIAKSENEAIGEGYVWLEENYSISFGWSHSVLAMPISFVISKNKAV